MDNNIETVEDFKNVWMAAGCPIRPPFKDAVFTTDIAYSLVLFRKPPFQVELYICKPNTSSPSHYHPGVDSCFVYLGGNLELNFDNEPFIDLQEFQKPREDGAHFLFGRAISSSVEKSHSLRVYEEGAAFLSFEKWTDREPTSVTVNWDGPLVGAEHAKTIESKT